MTRSERAGSHPDEEVLAQVRAVCSRHPVSFAMVFGSAGCGTMTDESDIDIAVEFDALRPADDGYGGEHLHLRSAFDDAVPFDVDVVDVHSMSPRFARAAFESGAVVVGSEDQQRELARDLAGDATSIEDAQRRVAAAVDRLHDDGSSGVSS